MSKYLRPITLALALVLISLFAFTVTAHAANVIDPTDGSADLLGLLYAALTMQHYAYAGALAMIALVAVLRRYGAARWPQLNTDAGSAMLVLVGSFGTTMAAGLAGGGPVTLGLLDTSAKLAFTAAGGYTMLKHLIVTPYLAPLAARGPEWLRSTLNVLLWLFQAAAPAPVPAPAPGNTPDDPHVS